MTILLKPSTNKNKKYMVKVKKDDKVYLIHFGSQLHKDYTIYYKELGKEEADKKKNAYIARHSKNNENWNDVLTPAYWSRWVSWNLPTIGASLNYIIKRDKLNLEPF